MAQPTNLFDKYDANNIREDLSGMIYDISPEETPFMSNVSRENVSNTYFEWLTDSLAAASTTNAAIEGDDATLDSRAPTNRVGNYTQISRKVVGTSGTIESVDSAGYKSRLAYDMARASSELKRDVETALLYNQASVIGDSTTARKTAGLPTWLTSNVSKAGDGSNGALTSAPNGYIDTARTDGTQRTFTEQMLKDVIQSMWSNGGDPRIMMAGAHNKTVASSFTGIQANRMNNTSAKPFAIVGTADVYLSEFGKVSMIANRFQRSRDVFVIDPEYAGVAYLRGYQTKKLAVTGDSERRMILVEFGLKVKNQAAHGIIADLLDS
jgi:hypothetical protein